MKRVFAFAILALALFVTVAPAHDTWILCDPAVVPTGHVLSVNMSNGVKFPVLESAPDPERVAKAEWRIGSKRGT
ncbi:MAG TPA: hypothetical protein VJS69_04220, partial [Candidatus Krumholzibacteria bacterium]|nr:hypothetical protein [Candidatus Krumholzibacteria bacterium]